MHFIECGWVLLELVGLVGLQLAWELLLLESGYTVQSVRSLICYPCSTVAVRTACNALNPASEVTYWKEDPGAAAAHYWVSASKQQLKKISISLGLPSLRAAPPTHHVWGKWPTVRQQQPSDQWYVQQCVPTAQAFNSLDIKNHSTITFVLHLLHRKSTFCSSNRIGRIPEVYRSWYSVDHIYISANCGLD